jgi:FkbM family methyltransferase
VSLDIALSRFTRHVPRFRGWHRLLEPVRRHYVRRYAGRPERWAEIADFEGDLKMRVDRAAYMGSLIYWRGIHSYAEAGVVRRFLPADGVFVDVGANQGELTLVAARRTRPSTDGAPSGRVLAFEPVREWFAHLEENVRLNGFRHVTLVLAALADREGEREMFTAGEGAGGEAFNEGLSSFECSSARHVPVGRVRTLRLDDVVREELLERVDLVKLDVEGAERLVLDGATETLARFHPMLLLEVNATTFAGPEPLAGWLRERGYSLFAVDPFARITPLADGARARHDTLFARHASRL